MKEMVILRTRAAMVALLATLFVGGASLAGERAEVIRLSEPVAQTVDTETFGSPLDEAVPAVSLEQILSDGESYVGKSVRVEARVSEV